MLISLVGQLHGLDVEWGIPKKVVNDNWITISFIHFIPTACFSKQRSSHKRIF